MNEVRLYWGLSIEDQNTIIRGLFAEAIRDNLKIEAEGTNNVHLFLTPRNNPGNNSYNFIDQNHKNQDFVGYSECFKYVIINNVTHIFNH